MHPTCERGQHVGAVNACVVAQVLKKLNNISPIQTWEKGEVKGILKLKLIGVLRLVMYFLTLWHGNINSTLHSIESTVLLRDVFRI